MKGQWKGFISGIMVSLLCFGFVGTAAATVGKQTAELDYNNINVALDGQTLSLSDANGNPVEPFAINGTTYLPVRAISSALGLEVGWIQKTSTVTLSTPEGAKPTYITRTGKKYHYDSTCNGGTYWQVPYNSATGMKLEPCDKCVLLGE